MKNTAVLLILSTIVLLSCESNSINSPIENNFNPAATFGTIDIDKADLALMTNENLAKADDKSLQEYEVKMKYFAMAIAKLLTDPEIGAYLKEEIGKQFDNDYDALWEVIADNEFTNKGKFKNIIRKLYNSKIDMVDQFNAVPLLQVSVPVHFDKWNISKTILVAYDPVTKEDTEVEELVAFDQNGKKYVLDAQIEPDRPVVVIGLNERVAYLESDKSTSFKKILGTAWNLEIVNFRLMDDHEPWWKGDPEIYVKTKKYGSSWDRTNFTKVNDEKTYWDNNHDWLPKTIYTTNINNPNTDHHTVFTEIWEDDINNDDLLEKDKYIQADVYGYPQNYIRTNDYFQRWDGTRNDADIWVRPVY